MTGESNPLILVFYIDRQTMSNVEFMNVFADSVRMDIESKNANIMAFFLPTDTEERVECVNPTQLAAVDMEKVNKLVNDIAAQFGMEEPEDIKDYSFLNGVCANDNAKSWDYLQWKNATNQSRFYLQRDWNQTLVTMFNVISARIHSKSCRRAADNIRLHSCFKELISTLEYYHESEGKISNRFTVTFDDSLPTDKIFVYSSEIFELHYIPKFEIGETKEIEEGYETEIKDLTFTLTSELPIEEVEEHKTHLWGYIKIENYEESDRI